MAIYGGTIWIDAVLIRETAKAVLLDTDAGEVWIPKWAIGARKRDEAGDVIRVELSDRVAAEKGLCTP